MASVPLNICGFGFSISSEMSSYLKTDIPNSFAVGCAGYLVGHLVSYIVNGASPAAFGVALGIGWAIARLADITLDPEKSLPGTPVFLGVVGGFLITSKCIYALTFTELLKTTAAVGVLAGIAVGALVIAKYMSAEKKA